jgi:hypothetical protein
VWRISMHRLMPHQRLHPFEKEAVRNCDEEIWQTITFLST